jgi:hypothetical protein
MSRFGHSLEWGMGGAVCRLCGQSFSSLDDDTGGGECSTAVRKTLDDAREEGRRRGLEEAAAMMDARANAESAAGDSERSVTRAVQFREAAGHIRRNATRPAYAWRSTTLPTPGAPK